MDDATVERYALEIADSITETARGSGDDPIAWVTGNAYFPPLRSFPLAEEVWQDDFNEDGEAFTYLTELAESHLVDANVTLEYPENDNSLYAVDLARFEYAENESDWTLQGDWRPVTD